MQMSLDCIYYFLIVIILSFYIRSIIYVNSLQRKGSGDKVTHWLPKPTKNSIAVLALMAANLVFHLSISVPMLVALGGGTVRIMSETSVMLVSPCISIINPLIDIGILLAIRRHKLKDFACNIR